jgi:hypothetical protein
MLTATYSHQQLPLLSASPLLCSCFNLRDRLIAPRFIAVAPYLPLADLSSTLLLKSCCPLLRINQLEYCLSSPLLWAYDLASLNHH